MPLQTVGLLGLCALLLAAGSPAQDPTPTRAPTLTGAPAQPNDDPPRSAHDQPSAARAATIDRHALVSRHNVSLRLIDPASPLMVGNGNFAFTADITGLQSFPEQYSRLVPLLTQAQWAWHSFPNPAGYRYEDSFVPVSVHGHTQYYPWLRDWSEASRPAIAWLRENPHRISLGRLSLYLLARNGQPARFADLSGTEQTLDLWNGVLLSRFELGDEPVQVQTRVHPYLDMLIVTLTSPALAAGRLGVDLRFPGVASALNPDPADWEHPDRHRTVVIGRSMRRLSLERALDDARYYVTAAADHDFIFTRVAPHTFRVLPGGPAKPLSITFMVLFSQQPHPGALPAAPAALRAVGEHWDRYWSTGGVVDLSGSTDPRAVELERRIVLSQYLMAVNAAGTLPPQEEGLFSNSWNGKFHLEMHLWHAAHFALWGHPELLERSMGWYLQHLSEARARARAHRAKGAWWPKMVGPEGQESPSTITPFIMWQQPSPIYLAELIHRARPTPATLARYRELVLETAQLLASFPYLDRARDEYMLGPPIIPAQEVFPPLVTFNPTFELEYFRFGLATAQTWRERLGLARSARWDEILQRLAPLPQRDGLYLATGSFPQLWEQARSAACSGGHTAPSCWNRDHPSLLAALGLLPGKDVDRETMRRTLRAVEAHWDLRQSWGWDFPLMAMTATRLHEPEKAIDFLLRDAPNNRFGLSGMTPRVHLENEPTGAAPPGTSRDAGRPSVATPSEEVPVKTATGWLAGAAGYHRDAETYFPSNGSLLLAVALMAAGWDGEEMPAPGFPHDGRWQVRTEGVLPLP
jgi:hypothetical protein